jgi:hypothetical protein
MESAIEPLAPTVSVARTVKLKVPVAVGIPEIPPVPELNDKPPGNAPAAIDHVSAPVPPFDASV